MRIKKNYNKEAKHSYKIVLQKGSYNETNLLKNL